MSQPDEFVDPRKPNHVCRLNKRIYGLKQSTRCWYDTLEKYLLSIGYRENDVDGCVYVKSVKKDNGHISFVILGVHVDDILPVSNDVEMLNAEKQALCQKFRMDDRGEVHFLLGMLINRDHKAKTITISQRNYMEKILTRFGMESCKRMSTPMENGKKSHEVRKNEKVC